MYIFFLLLRRKFVLDYKHSKTVLNLINIIGILLIGMSGMTLDGCLKVFIKYFGIERGKERRINK